ncbi:MAG TPA: hypothetical protein VFE02_10225 [Candidatus Acidoferrales bacterium]|jgi:hypothetical protein|nr:hypothetical protein [Candidatus Acidoferrales bacterium]
MPEPQQQGSIDYDALAAKHGALSLPAVDYDALASKHGALPPAEAAPSTPAPASPSNQRQQPPQQDPDSSISDKIGSYWEWAKKNILDRSAFAPLQGQLDAAKQANQQIVDHEVNSGHPWRAAIASAFYGSLNDTNDLILSATTPKNVALAFAGPLGRFGKVVSLAANSYFAMRGAQALMEERQAGETLADEVQRKLFGAAAMTGAAGGEGATLKDFLHDTIQNKLGLKGDLAAKVSQKVAGENSLRQGAVKDITGIENATQGREAAVGADASSNIADSLSTMSEADRQAAEAKQASTTQAQTQTQQVSQRSAAVAQQIPNRLGKIIADARQAVTIEQAKASQPFEDIGQQIKDPVTDNASIKAVVMDTLRDHGVQEHEVPNKIFAALKPMAEIDGAEGFSPSIRASLKRQIAEPVTFNDLTRVRDDLWQGANSAKDGAMRSGLFDAVGKVTKMQEDFADANGLGSQYKVAKQGYMKFMRELGSGTMADFLHADSMQQQNMDVRLKDLTTGSTASTLRNMMQIAGVDVKPLDDLLGEQETIGTQGKQIPKDLNANLSSAEAARLETIKQAGSRAREAASNASKSVDEIQSQGREAASGINQNMEADIQKLGENNPIIQGQSDLLLKGKTTEEIRQEAMNHLSLNAKVTGITNPSGYIMLTYGLMKMAMGNPYGVLTTGYGAARIGASDLVRNPSFQDWMIRESGVEPSNTALIGRMRKSIESLAPTLKAYERARELAKTGALAGTANQAIEPQAQPQQVPAAMSSGATIGDQILAKRAALLSAPQQSNPALPFHPGAGVPR